MKYELYMDYKPWILSEMHIQVARSIIVHLSRMQPRHVNKLQNRTRAALGGRHTMCGSIHTSVHRLVKFDA